MSIVDPLMNGLAQLLLVKRKEKSDWEEAVRFVARDLRRIVRDLSGILFTGMVPPLDATMLPTAAWDRVDPVFARQIPNSDEGENFWFGISDVFDLVRGTRGLLALRLPGTALDRDLIEIIEHTADQAAFAYDCIADAPLPRLARRQVALPR